MLALVTSLDSVADRLTGITILLGGCVVMVGRRSWLVGALMVLAGLSWLMPVVSVGSVSSLFVHRALLAAGLAVAAKPLWRDASSAAPLVALGVVSIVPSWSQRPVWLLAAWGAVITHTAFVLQPSPRRARVVPALVAQGVMLGVASFGRTLDVLTLEERRLVYLVATMLLVVLTLRVVIAPVVPEAVLDGRPRRSSWAIGLRPLDAQEFVTADGQSVATLPFLRAIEFDVGDLGTAVLAHDDPAFEDSAMRQRLHGAVRLVSERIAVLSQINAQRVEVEASRRRLLEAERSAALAIKRDVELDVQPHLDGIVHTLRALDVRDGRAVELLAEIRREVDDLVSGATPVALADGLLPALQSLADRAIVPTMVDLEPVDVDEAGAVALFMVASEALTNAAKHSQSTRITISLVAEGEWVALRVADDGIGGAAARPHGGIDHAAQRLAEHGGSLAVDSPPGRGTVVVARLPRGRP